VEREAQGRSVLYEALARESPVIGSFIANSRGKGRVPHRRRY